MCEPKNGTGSDKWMHFFSGVVLPVLSVLAFFLCIVFMIGIESYKASNKSEPVKTLHIGSNIDKVIASLQAQLSNGKTIAVYKKGGER